MTCLNPKTQKLIKINGPTFKKLVKEGYSFITYIEI